MIEAVLVVLTNAVAGREEDFDDWYTHIHMRDALRFRGSIAAQRFKWAEQQAQDYPSDYGWDYMALYDVFDPSRFSQEHIENALTSRMMVTDAIRMDGLNDYHYYPIQFRDNSPGTPHDGGVIMEQIKVAEGDLEAFIYWYNAQYFAAAVARAGVRKGAFMKFLPQGQLVDMVPVHNFVATWHIDDAATIDVWRLDEALKNCPLVDQHSLSVTCWEPVTPKTSEDEVIHTSAAALADEERARAHMGTRVMTDRGDELKAS
jgi:predicted SnoaL-like aldol condensation-catalyzing enzyme